MKRSFSIRLASFAIVATFVQTCLAQIPLTDMVFPQTYMGQQGGLYFNYNNNRPPFWQNAVLTEANQVVPRDFVGNPAKNGFIGFVSIGMSNTFQEWSVFAPLAQSSTLMDPQVILVNGAQGGMHVVQWGSNSAASGVYSVLASKVAAAGLTPPQVQVVWIKQSLKQPATFGAWPGHMNAYMLEMRSMLQQLRAAYPNLRVAYISSRIYAGYATVPLSPEPYAYEQAYAVRQLIKHQATGNPTLNWNPSAGPVMSPILCWGPYMWANGTTPRSDGLVWNIGDFMPDGTHPAPSGRNKVANMMLKFFAFDSTCGWFQP